MNDKNKTTPGTNLNKANKIAREKLNAAIENAHQLYKKIVRENYKQWLNTGGLDQINSMIDLATNAGKHEIDIPFDTKNGDGMVLSSVLEETFPETKAWYRVGGLIGLSWKNNNNE